MRIFLLAFFVLSLFSCDTENRSTQYVFVIQNNSSDTVQVCLSAEFINRTNIIRGCSSILSGDDLQIAEYYGSGDLFDFWNDSEGDTVIIDELTIYRDSVLIDKNFLTYEKWEYSLVYFDVAEYRLTLEDSDLN